MKKLVGLVRRVVGFFAWSATLFAGAPFIIQGPWVTGVTRSTALFSWVTDQPSNSTVRWGLSPGFHPNASTGAGSALIHVWYASGAPGNSRIYYVVCSANGVDPETCSPEFTFNTQAQATVPAAPIAPQPVDTPIAPNGNVWTVGGDCDDPNTGLVARWSQANWGDIVEIDPVITPKCAGSYVFPAKAPDSQTPHRYILTRVKNADANLGGRQVEPGDKPNMARFVHTGPNISMTGNSDPTPEICFAGTYRWRQGQNNNWALYRCNNTNPLPIAAIPSSGNLRLTVPGHGIGENSMTWVSGVTGSGAGSVNGPWKIHVIDGNTVELHPYIDSGALQATGPANGGTIAVNRYQLEPVTEGSVLPTSCAYGSWWHKRAGSGSEDEYHRTWYCNAPDSFNNTLFLQGPHRGPSGEWMPYRMDPNANATPYPPIDLISNKAHHLIFQGLRFEPLALKADPQRAQFMYVPSNFPTGTLFWNFIGQSRYNNHIYWNQVLGQCVDPDPDGSMVRCHAFANPLDGSHISVKQSYFAGFQIFHSAYDLDDGNALVFGVNHGPGPHEISNNHIECAGICVYYTDDAATMSDAGDLTFTNNYVETPDRYWDRSPSWIGPNFANFSNPLYWSQRHRLELKRLKRGLISGNTFVGGWVWNNNASAICLCTRGGNGGMQMTSMDGATITTSDASPTSDWGVEDLKVGDMVSLQYLSGGSCTANPAQVYNVSSIINSYTFTISPPPGCTAAHGNVVRIASTSTYISDININNNVMSNVPTGIYILGHDSYGGGNGLPSAAMQRVAISNNLAIGIDGTRVGLGSYSSTPQVAPAGTFVVPTYGMEDLIVSHNTVYQRTSAAFMNTDSGVGGPSSGLILKANIFESLYGAAINNGSSYYGSAALDHSWTSGGTPEWVAAYNVILRPGGGSGSPYDPTYPPFGPYPLMTKWFDPTAATFPFSNPSTGDYSLSGLFRAGDRCYSVAGDCTDDGKDVGVNMNVLPATVVNGLIVPRQ